jgi:hypothetical protein
MSFIRQQLSIHIPVALDMYATIEELLERVFSMPSMPELGNGDHPDRGSVQEIQLCIEACFHSLIYDTSDTSCHVLLTRCKVWNDN